MRPHPSKPSYTLPLLAGLLLTRVAFAQAPDPGDRYIVELTAGNDPSQVAAAHGIATRQVYGRVLTGFAARIPPGRVQALARDPRVARVVVDHAVSANGKPVKPPPPPPPGETVPAGVGRVLGTGTVPETGNGVGVAILDTGLDFSHADLPVSDTSSFVSPGFTYTTSAQDDAGHGTHVGGTVAAIQGNNLDVVGVAPGATLYAVKVLDGGGSGYDSDVISGLEWVAANAQLASPPIRVVNMSLGRGAAPDDGDSLMHAAIQAVVAEGITVVVSAGNDERFEVSQMVPAGFPEVIAVASTTAKAGTSNNKRVKPIPADTASFFTTDGIGVSISAPGEEQENIAYPFINSLGILSTALGGGTTRMSGTSMAAPHVTGVVALLLEKAPGLTPVEVKARIQAGDRKTVAPLDAAGGSYTFDGVREGILYAPNVLAP